MKQINRVFLIVLDSFGIGAAPDAALFGDAGANTLAGIARTGKLTIPNLISMGLSNIDGVSVLPKSDSPTASYARLTEKSLGKDTTTGHWEIAGIISHRPMPTYPNGFPPEVMSAFEAAVGRGTLCNLPYSGTDVIRDYGEEHLQTGKLIIYTSADSVFQIAAHESIVPVEELYRICQIARDLLQGEHSVGRVIARPFVGEAGNFRRTENRRDFSLLPPAPTVLNRLSARGYDVIGVGKIGDIFSMAGITETHPTHNNREGMEVTSALVKRDFHGLCFVNLVDFDMLYGHRQDADGYAAAMSEFDRWLGEFMKELRPDDVLLITADHGCDPTDSSTDHTREHVPYLMYGAQIAPENRGTLMGFDTVGEDVYQFLTNTTMTEETHRALIDNALSAREKSYCPYSGFAVGAALLAEDGTVYTGANIESASYSPTICAERVAMFTAVHQGARKFTAMAIVGGKRGEAVSSYCPPCGVCRQVMAEFCQPDFPVILFDGTNQKILTLDALLPESFSKADLGTQ